VTDPDLVAAIGQILRTDPRRALAVADSLRGEGRCVESTVSGASMHPGLPSGSRIRIALAPQPCGEPGQVVAYLVAGQVIVHRVFHCGRAGAARRHLLARGDATLVPDPPVEIAQVLGPVTGVWRTDQWSPTTGAPHRSPHARLVRAVLAALSIAGLMLSPRATGRVLVALHRAAGMVRDTFGGALQRRRAGRGHGPF
jgi:hypothetical protein